MKILLHNKTTKENVFFKHLKAFEFNTVNMDLSGYLVLSGERRINRFLQQQTKKYTPDEFKKSFAIRLTQSVVENLHANANSRGITISRLIENILEDYLE